MTPSERTRYEYRGDYQLSSGNLVLFGAQRDDESVSTTDPRPFGAGNLRARNGNTAGDGEAQLTPFERASLVANIRHDENDAFGPATTFRVAPSYVLPFTETRIKGSVGTGPPSAPPNTSSGAAGSCGWSRTSWPPPASRRPPSRSPVTWA